MISLIVLVSGLLMINSPYSWGTVPIMLVVGLILLVIFFMWERKRIMDGQTHYQILAY